MPDGRTLPSDVLRGIVVLVIDDNRDTVDLLVVVLSMFGATAVGATSVAEAVEALESIDPHLIVTDLNMPVEDGYALLDRVRDRTPKPTEPVPVVAFTASTDPKTREEVAAAGFDGYLAKPVDPGDFVRAVVGWLA
jgi:CheY-like chemotaxis protein